MQDEKKDFYELLKKQLAGELTVAEMTRLDKLLGILSEQEQQSIMHTVWEEQHEMADAAYHPFSRSDSARLLKDILDNEHLGEKVDRSPTMYRRRLWISVAAAVAVIAVVITFAVRHYTYSGPELLKEQPTQLANNPTGVAPGSNRALFLSDDGEAIAIDGQEAGVIKSDQNYQIVRLPSGEIHYQNRQSSVVTQHTVKTPRGGQVNFMLPDGTKVWLNAASSITFSSDLDRGDRKVVMSGEAYFDVAKSADRNFIVEGNFGQIEVLGTRFNVNTYDQTNATAALLSGAIRLTTSAQEIEMKPMQLTSISAQGKVHTVVKQDLEKLVLWKDGFFHFDQATPEQIAAEVARWYNIHVHVNSRKVGTKISGTIAKDVSLAQMIDMLDYLGISCTYTNSQLTLKTP